MLHFLSLTIYNLLCYIYPNGYLDIRDNTNLVFHASTVNLYSLMMYDFFNFFRVFVGCKMRSKMKNIVNSQMSTTRLMAEGIANVLMPFIGMPYPL